MSDEKKKNLRKQIKEKKSRIIQKIKGSDTIDFKINRIDVATDVFYFVEVKCIYIRAKSVIHVLFRVIKLFARVS